MSAPDSPPPKPAKSPPSTQPSFSEPKSRPPSLFADIDGVSVHHTLTPPSRPPQYPSPHLICVHGFGASLFSFSLLHHLTEGSPFTLLPFDLPGFGLTSRPRPLDYYTPHFGQRIIFSLANAYTPHLPFTLMAHSMGTLSAVRATLSNPTRISALILIAPALVPATPLPPFLRMMARLTAGLLAWLTIGASLLLGPVLAFVLRRYVGSKSFWRSGLAIARQGPVPESVIDGYYAPTSAKGWDRGVLNFVRASLRDRARALGEAEDFVAMLSTNQHCPPVLIVHGDCDRVVPLANSRSLAEKIPGARLAIMKDCGHVPHEERPDEFVRIVREFLHKAGVGKEEV